MSYYTPNDHDRERLHADRYNRQGEGGAGWLVVAGIVLAVIVALVAFGGGGGSTTDVHPGGAGAPPVNVPDAGGTAPAVDPRPDVPAQ